MQKSAMHLKTKSDTSTEHFSFKYGFDYVNNICISWFIQQSYVNYCIHVIQHSTTNDKMTVNGKMGNLWKKTEEK
jgi:hypothetical protein